MINKVFTSLLSLFILLLFSNNGFSEPSPTVYILNSSRSVEKFFLTERSFKNYFSGKVKSIDLKGLSRKRETLEKNVKPLEDDLIYSIGSRALSFALKNFSKNRIIFSSVINWKRFDLTNKTYGISGEIPIETQITLFKHILPSIKKVGIIYSLKFNREWFDLAQQEAKKFNLELIGLPLNGAKSFNKVLADLFSVVDSIWLVPDPGVITRSSFFKFIAKSEEMKKPILTYNEAFVESGAVLAVSVDDETIGRQVAVLIERMINKETIKEKIQRPAGSSIVLDLKRAKKFKLKINPDALGDINRIIE